MHNTVTVVNTDCILEFANTIHFKCFHHTHQKNVNY